MLSVYLHFQQFCARPLCKELPASPETLRQVPALGSLRSAGKETYRGQHAEVCNAEPKGQSGKGAGGHLLGAPCVTEEETVVVQLKNIQAIHSEGQWQRLDAGFLNPRPALRLP